MARNWTIKHGRPNHDFLEALEIALLSDNVTKSTATKVVIGDGGYKAVFTGEGFDENPSGPQSGTVTGIKIVENGKVIATASGYALDIGLFDQPFNDLKDHDDFSGFMLLLFGYPGPRIVIDGSDDRDVLEIPGGVPHTFRGNGGNDRFLGSTSGDKIYGGTGKDQLYGRGGNDLIKGGKGNDTISGGAGFDNLTGGPGRDQFLFDTLLGNGNNQAGVDKIMDFEPGIDTIGLRSSVFSAIGAKLNKGEFHVGGNAQEANHHIIYKKSTGALFYDADGVGGAGKIKFAELKGQPKLAHDDFFMF